MTREEAIEVLEEIQFNLITKKDDPYDEEFMRYEALGVAIYTIRKQLIREL